MAFLNFNKSELVNLAYSLKREIICANKTGDYCNTSIVTCNTRSYHGLLAVPIDKFGGREYLLLSSLDESLIANGKSFNLGIHCYGDVYEPRGHKYIIDFDADPVPKITYKVGEAVFVKTILLAPDKDQVMIKYDLIQAPGKTELQLKPFLAFRNIHSLTAKNDVADLSFKEVKNGVSFRMYEDFPDLFLQTDAKKAEFVSVPDWYRGITYSDEYRRGFDCKEDLFVPGYFKTTMAPGDSVIFSASVALCKSNDLRKEFTKGLAKNSNITSAHEQLIHCADLLKRDRGGHEMITAGFSWLYTGLLRETIESLPGLTLYADGNKAEFEEILDNLIHDEQERLFVRTTQVEAPLYLTYTLQQYITFSGDEKKIWKKYGDTMKKIIESYSPGHRKEVSMQPNGLLWAQMNGVALTWMNAYIHGVPVTERAGYQVDTNALWYNAVCFALAMELKYGSKDSEFVKKWFGVRDLIKNNFQPTFWNEQLGYLADYVDNNGQNMDVRPNQMFAVGLPYSPISDEIADSVMKVVDNELVTKRGIRTLSPRDSKYKGVYEGTQIDRDLAYHQGCAMPSLLGMYVEIGFMMHGADYWKKAQWLTEGFYDDLNKHGVGAFSEIYDGDPPHEPHGAISSALSTAALLRVDYLISKNKEDEK